MPGTKPAIVVSGLGISLILPFLAAVSTAPALAVALFGFGATLQSRRRSRSIRRSVTVLAILEAA